MAETTGETPKANRPLMLRQPIWSTAWNAAGKALSPGPSGSSSVMIDCGGFPARKSMPRIARRNLGPSRWDGPGDLHDYLSMILPGGNPPILGSSDPGSLRVGEISLRLGPRSRPEPDLS